MNGDTTLNTLATPEGLFPDVANPGAFKPDREFVFAGFISAKPACGIRNLLIGRDSICDEHHMLAVATEPRIHNVR